eukprot:11584550-Ditylum_brightwellii.AAC.1
MNGLEVTAYWQPLTLNDLPVQEPEHDDTSLCPPNEQDVATPKSKHGFKETFRRPEFTGKDTSMMQCKTYES